MAGRRPLSDESREELKAALKNARSVDDYRRAQCLYLRVVLRFNSTQVARIVGWAPTSVCHLHRQYLRHGDAVLRMPGRGRARWRLLSVPREAEVLSSLGRKAGADRVVPFPAIQQAFEEEAGRPMPPIVIYEILDRHGWMLGGVFVLPRRVPIPEEYRALHRVSRPNNA